MRRLLAAAALSLATVPAAADDGLLDQYVLSNAEHTLWHEAGHALISEFGLAVLGQEEDAVDSFATLIVLAAEDEDRLERLLDVAELWIISHELAEEAGEEPAYYAEHDLDAQRGLRVVCFIAGEGPGRAYELVDAWGLPEERAETCEFDYEQALDGWETLLDPHFAEDGQPGAPVTMRYGPSGEWEAWLRETELLEAVAEELSYTFRLAPGLEIEADSCGEPNAFWDPEARTVTLCYELLDLYRELAEEA